MLMVLAQRMEMILRDPIGPHTVLRGLKKKEEKIRQCQFNGNINSF